MSTTQPLPSGKPCYRILSIDGGGVRGIIPAIWLEDLEKRLGGPLYEYFDLIVGTSTGSILACSVAAGMPASQAVDFYKRCSSSVFPQDQGKGNVFSRAKDVLRQLYEPKYSGEGLTRVLNNVFADLKMGDLKRPTMITSFNLINRRALMLKSWQERHDELRVADVCQASSAAPTFFPAHVIELGHAKLPLIDGGVVAGSPSSVGLTEAMRLNRKKGAEIELSQYVMVSLGTGVTADQISIKQGKTWGLRHWAAPLFDIVLDGSRQVADYHCRHMLGPKRYFRLQTRLNGEAEGLDDSSDANLNTVAAVAEHWLQHPEGQQKMEKVVSVLQTCELADNQL